AMAMDAGLDGEVTDATRLLAATGTGIEEMDATRALERTSLRRPATQAPVPSTPYRRDPTGAYSTGAGQPTKAEKRARLRKRLSLIFLALAAAVAIAAVIFALQES